MTKVKPVLYVDERDCCGCTACASICPNHAITFDYDAEGFLYPNIDPVECVSCYKCIQVCAFKKDIEKPIQENAKAKIYAAKARDNEVVLHSSSGGIFTSLSDFFIGKGDVIASCLYSYEKKSVSFAIYDDKKTRDEARGSKYIQAELNDSFGNIIMFLKENPARRILVVGTGCQIAGLDLLLKKLGLRDRVVLVDLICHGAASSKLWKIYIRKIEEADGSSIFYLTFKNKRNGWENPSTFVKLGKKEISIKPYADWFYMGLSLRKSCYRCPYTRVDRNSDITIGDYWGIKKVMPDFYDKNGVSLVIVHTPVGDEVFNEIKSEIQFRESNRTDCLQPRLMKPQSEPENRMGFWYDIHQRGLKYCEKRYKEREWLVLKTIKSKFMSIFRGKE